ncbi:metal ABC transporter ATP-binding protein [Leptotrichia sp. OH3620_COT-345]|uniref:metal ABC transporter ATP-binding protein n=1 Tax=Leptotrichia sp. OH3620_COT-345 TaxID=2491048 RepID=UPI000F650236|nr:metal ABC transporter ATP-binding protein [Leptotrichia sp. OH3620_COT-345]RRD40456.1 metal ABC transporter ATP-binding protein [Leptotrichia sp. OH3620_COT-345]
MSGILIEIKNLTLTLSNTKILENINLTVEPGKIHCLVGPNGGGKTSLLKSILGQVPYEGEIFISYEKSKIIGYVPQYLDFEKTLPITVEDFLAIIYQKKPCFLGISRKYKKTVDELLRKMGMYEKRKRLVGNLSGGERQRLLLAQAIYPEPDLLILDEPFTGIDVLGEEYFKSVINNLKNKGITILWIHHNLKQVIEMADTVTCIKKEIQFSGDPKKVLDNDKILTVFS